MTAFVERDEAVSEMQETIRILLSEFGWGWRASRDAHRLAPIGDELFRNLVEDWRRVFRIVVASQGDVSAEREIVSRVTDQLNRGVADAMGRYIKVWRWECDALPGLHPLGPQGRIDELVSIEDADVAVELTRRHES